MPGHALVLIDLQERLFAAMDAERRDEVIANVKILVAAARRLGIPILVTEQYPKASATGCQSYWRGSRAPRFSRRPRSPAVQRMAFS